jgi:hypothetical protein
MEDFTEVVDTATGIKQSVPTEWLDHPILGRNLILPPSVLAKTDLPNEKWSKARIEDFAAAHDIDLTDATTKADMVARISELTTVEVVDPQNPDPNQGTAETPATGDEEN